MKTKLLRKLRRKVKRYVWLSYDEDGYQVIEKCNGSLQVDARSITRVAGAEWWLRYYQRNWIIKFVRNVKASNVINKLNKL